MEFVNPAFLYGLIAVSIPVIIHLFNFRRFRKVYFTNVSFIRELKQETQKQSKLKHLLVLIARMLAIAALVIAFARPYIPVSKNLIQPQETHAVSIYVDNSFSMEAESEKGSLLNDAKDKALEIGGIYKTSDRYQILSNDFEGRHQRLISKDEFQQWVGEIDISPVARNISEVMQRQQDVLHEAAAKIKTAYLISDYQKGFLTGDNFRDTTIDYYLIPLTATNADNLYIDSIWFDAPVQMKDQLVELKARIINSGINDLEKIPVKLMINGLQKSLASLDIQAGESKELDLPFTNPGTGILQGQLVLNDHPISFDDVFYFSYEVAPVIRILCINGSKPNPYLDSFFLRDSTFSFKNVEEGKVDYSAIRDYNLVILNEPEAIASGLEQTLLKYMETGGSVIFIPSMTVNPEDYNAFLMKAGPGKFTSLDTATYRINYINLDHPVYADVFDEIPENIDLPVVLKSFVVKYPSRSNYEVLLRMQNDNPFLSIEHPGYGRFYLFASSLTAASGNFVRHALFVPTLYKMAISSISVDQLYYTIGKDEMIRVEGLAAGNDEPVKIKAMDRDFEIIPENKFIPGGVEILTHGQIKQAGNYALVYNGQIIKGVAFNYDRRESEMVFYSSEDIENWISDNHLDHVHLFEVQNKLFSQAVTDLNRGVQLWKWFVLAALLFILTEVLLLRFLKN